VPDDRFYVQQLDAAPLRQSPRLGSKRKDRDSGWLGRCVDGAKSERNDLGQADASVSQTTANTPLLPWRSFAGRLQIAVITMFLTMIAANAQALANWRLCQWPSCLMAAGSVLLGLWATMMSRGALRRLDRLTTAMLQLAESTGRSTEGFCGTGDEIDKAVQALDVFRENSRRALVSEANLKAAVENMVEGIVMISADGKVALHNQRLLEIFGLPPMNAVGLSRVAFNMMLVQALDWPQSAQEYLQSQLASIRGDGQYRVFDLELPGNRVLRYSASVLVDGNVMSYIEDISEQRAAAKSILHLAHHDILTDLPNRALFQERLAAAVEGSAVSEAGSASLLLVDLDRFKAVNDTYGHPTGDELLRQATQRMRDHLRSAEIIARLGGDEFAIIHLNDRTTAGAERLSRRLIEVMEQPFEIHGHQVRVGASIGIANAPLHANTVEDIMKCADLALYAAKQGGRNTFRIFDPAMSMRVGVQSDLEEALHEAVAHGGLHLHYQPQVEMRGQRIVGFEALARWDHPQRGAISPGVFIPLAERTGLIIQLGEWALRQAAIDAMQWPDAISVSVNVAPHQLRVPDFVDMVRDVLASSGLAPARLELEITESAPLHDDAVVLGVLQDLARLGVRVSMDDFGTGHTGLSYLHRFRFDTLKIDQSFVRGLGDWKEAELIVRAIVELGATLEVRTVAEGIETERQAAILARMNCTIGQGYLFGRPVAAQAAARMVGQQDGAGEPGAEASGAGEPGVAASGAATSGAATSGAAAVTEVAAT
jgi:diguanylate cyclase (GGDEF)-like protein